MSELLLGILARREKCLGQRRKQSQRSSYMNSPRLDSIQCIWSTIRNQPQSKLRYIAKDPRPSHGMQELDRNYGLPLTYVSRRADSTHALPPVSLTMVQETVQGLVEEGWLVLREWFVHRPTEPVPSAFG